MRQYHRFFAAALLAVLPFSAQADEVTDRIEGARSSYQSGKFASAAIELQKALAAIQNRMAADFIKVLPPAPPGWTADDPEIQGLGLGSSGFAVIRTYISGDQGITASLVLDEASVEPAMAALSAVQGARQPGSDILKIAGESALLHWDEEDKSGEAMMVVDKRVLLQVEGSGMKKSDVLVDMMKGWNIAQLKKLVKF